ncbi:hypothetical protein [Marixanthomonas ophiurae]|uniref:HTH cro/C1-type domain-containing protein n=1 Tax=Marixanthomonas ophiurae TaxID=387659 RepID=A0A3E1QDV7_9FLAO|nr:hypothetical protein [Marixanthomonas ophiurae]RFN60338.1 hypothetical protein DZ858_09945 [Marixanthomonas ophiurae]
MQNEFREKSSIKIAVALNLLLIERKTKLSNKLKLEEIANSYNEIALNADIRKATVSDTFNAKTIPSSLTLLQIIEGMGSNLSDFAKIYDSITDKEIKAFEKDLNS